MKWTEMRFYPNRYGKEGYKASAKGIKYEVMNIPLGNGRWYVMAYDKKDEDRVYNTSWDRITFATAEQAQEYCTSFKFKN